jgi:pyruvate dehydrogenase E1 component
LQHQDGSSHVIAATVPNCRAYDPAFACELAVIIDHGMRRMMEQQADEFYYITMMNENYAQPSLPPDVEPADIIKGMYHYASRTQENSTAPVRLLGSGAILCEVIAAAELLAQDWSVSSEVHSVTSFSELARDAAGVQRWNRLHPLESPRVSHVEQQLQGAELVVAATDYVRAYPQLIAPYLGSRFVTLGTDGFGRSDTRLTLRRFFEVDRHSVVLATLDALARKGHIPRQTVAQAIQRYGIETQAMAPWTC